LGFLFHARRSMSRQSDQLRNNSDNQDECSCDRDPIAINFEWATAANFGHRQSACLPADEFSRRKRLIL
jgi:hypothetical protein